MSISKRKAAAGTAVAGAVVATGLALGVSPAMAYSGYTVSNVCGSWAGANHAVTMENIYGGWDLVPCGYTYLNIAAVYYGGPGYLKVQEYPNTCFPTGSTAIVHANTRVDTQSTCY